MSPKTLDAGPSQGRCPTFHTLLEVAAICRAPLSSVRVWCATDKLKSQRVGRRRLVREVDLLAFLDAA